MELQYRDWQFTAITELWTGDASQRNTRLMTTGLLGSIRWWFEVLVRGLGGSACDPTSESRCPEKSQDQTRRCVVCELFGCTGWARKFRFEVVDRNGRPIQDALKAGTSFTLRFTPLRRIMDEEWTLLDLTLQLIAEYAAIGGKTVYKPSDEPGRDRAEHHKDYGLIRLETTPFIQNVDEKSLRNYVSQTTWRKLDHRSIAWASLNHFFAVKGYYLARQSSVQSTFNRVLGRPEAKKVSTQGNNWLAGSQGVSKRVFSFKTPGYERIYGFANSEDQRQQIIHALKTIFSIESQDIITGKDVLRQLLQRSQGGQK